MQVNNISATTFNGKAKFLSGIKKNEKAFAKEILDFEVNGKTNRQLLSENNFDISFFDSKKNPSSDTLYLSVPIKYLVRRGGEILSPRDLQMHEINIESGVEAGAHELRNIIEKIDNDITNRYPTQYNTWLQKVALRRTMHQ